LPIEPQPSLDQTGFLADYDVDFSTFFTCCYRKLWDGGDVGALRMTHKVMENETADWVQRLLVHDELWCLSNRTCLHSTMYPAATLHISGMN
jgi:hypothetical protein